MILKHFFAISITLTLSITNLTAQSFQTKPENYFGLHVKPLIPLGLVGDKSFVIKSDNFKTTISPLFGYSYGALVRIGLSELLAIETGINYTKRNYKSSYSLPDSNIYTHDEVSYVSFDMPINFLVYIKMSKKIFMNVGVGASLNYNPSSIFSGINPEGEHLFLFKGQRSSLFNFNTNADIGVEYRTQDFGTLYLGMSGYIPFSSTLEITSVYRNGTYETFAKGEIKGSTFALNLKYFFHNHKTKKEPNFKEDQ